MSHEAEAQCRGSVAPWGELMFPTEATLSSLHIFGDLSEEEETQFDDRFAQITES